MSACCLCWNPVDYQGACGCYFGISTCKTEKLKSDIKIQYPNEILIFTSNIEQTMGYITELGINTNDMNDKYIALKSNSTYRSAGVYVVNDYEEYY